MDNFKIAITTRSMNDFLYKRMRYLFGRNCANYEFIQLKNFPAAKNGSRAYLYHIIKLNYDWIINIDEDMFVFNFENIISLLKHMIENNFDYCGISDGGMCCHRFHSPIVMNPFFNIFNSKKIRNVIDNIPKDFAYSDDMKKYIPHNLKNGYYWNNDDCEPFYPFFYWLPANKFFPLYCNAYEIEDGWINSGPNKHLKGISTIVKNHMDKEIGIHTWYARKYGIDKFHTDRIDMAYQYALGKKVSIL